MWWMMTLIVSWSSMMCEVGQLVWKCVWILLNGDGKHEAGRMDWCTVNLKDQRQRWKHIIDNTPFEISRDNSYSYPAELYYKTQFPLIYSWGT